MIIVDRIKKTLTDSGTVLSARVSCQALGLSNYELFYQFQDKFVDGINPTADPFLPPLIIPAMYWGEDLQIDWTASEKLFEGIKKVMQIFSQWYSDLKPVKIAISDVHKSSQSGRHIALFFSGGVDSYYTMLKNNKALVPKSEKISHLLFVHGFDIPLFQTTLFQDILIRIKRIASIYDKELLVVRTNVRELIGNFWPWAMYHGTAMAGVALSLEGFLRRVYISADYSYKHYTMMGPYGSHPLIDPLFGTESIEIIFDGAEATRIEKIEQICQDRFALDDLRVCFTNTNGSYNCGSCEKCIRTKLSLKALGLLERCASFDNELDPKKIKNLRLDRYKSIYMQENHKALLSSGADRKLIKSVKECLKSSLAREKRKLRKAGKAVELGESDLWISSLW